MDELLKQILTKLESMDSRLGSLEGGQKKLDSKLDGLDSKIDWAVAELKNEGKGSEKAMTLFTPIETTEAIERDLKAIKVKLFDVETKLNRR